MKSTILGFVRKEKFPHLFLAGFLFLMVRIMPCFADQPACPVTPEGKAVPTPVVAYDPNAKQPAGETPATTPQTPSSVASPTVCQPEDSPVSDPKPDGEPTEDDKEIKKEAEAQPLDNSEQEQADSTQAVVISPSKRTPAEIKPLPGNPGVARVAPPGNTTSVSATTRGALLNYNTTVGGWAGGGFTFDNFSTPPIETVDLRGISRLTFGLKGNVQQVKLELVDNQDRKAHVYLTGIRAGKEKVWVVRTSYFSGINLAKVRLIYFIVEGPGLSGKLEINQKPPQAAYARGTPVAVPSSEDKRWAIPALAR